MQNELLNNNFYTKRSDTWTHLYPLILNLSNELLTFFLSSERRGKLAINTPSPLLRERERVRVS